MRILSEEDIYKKVKEGKIDKKEAAMTAKTPEKKSRMTSFQKALLEKVDTLLPEMKALVGKVVQPAPTGIPPKISGVLGNHDPLPPSPKKWKFTIMRTDKGFIQSVTAEEINNGSR